MSDQNTSYKDKLEALRKVMAAQGLDGFIVPRADEYQGEFVAAYAARLRWLTGFTGSAGSVVVLSGKAAVFTDARYTIQLRNQIDPALYETFDIANKKPALWIAEQADEGQVIGYDPWLHSARDIETLEKAGEEKSLVFKPVENPVDQIWSGQPPRPQEPVSVFPDEIAGASPSDKYVQVKEILVKAKVQSCIIALPSSLAWFLNVRGNDVPYHPLVLSYAIVHADEEKIQWFVDDAKITKEVRAHLGSAVEIIPPEDIGRCVDELSGTVALDFARSSIWFKQRLEGRNIKIVDLKDPTVDLKAVKTQAEQKSIRAAHIRDGVALVKFLCWLDEHAQGQSEISVADKLEAFRAQDKTYRGPSFPTISGFAGNGAIVHYRATKKSDKRIEGSGLLLVDSGGQYPGGTTDITRTIAIGAPTQEMKENFTRVLKGHIGVARARFPEGTTGVQIDVLARQPLWEAGLDYAHGTGHGVGCYLSVHEEAANLSPRGHDALKAGMLLSNEPGYYKEGAYGIRIENLILVKEDGICADTGKKMLGFETVSFAPIDLNLVEKDMLSPAEIAWLDAYHKTVAENLSPSLEADQQAWVLSRTRPLP